MSTIPRFEEILVAAEQCFGFHSGQTKTKQKFMELGLSMAKHDEKLAEILQGLLNALELNEDDSRYFFINIMDWYQFYKKIELNIWTFDVDKKQVVWFFLGYVFIPFIARATAYWNIDGFKGKGMPNQFWYLPKLFVKNKEEVLLLPIQQVMEWLEDLLNQPMDKIKESLEGQLVDVDSVERSLYNWKNGKLPRNDKIEQYFSDKTNWNFQGCYQPISSSYTLDEKFEDAKEFLINKKELDEEGIRDQLLIANTRLDRVFGDSATDDDKELFITAVIERYTVPDMHTLRKRFRLARAGQDAYTKLMKFLCPGVDLTEVERSENKLLQLISQYQRVCNLTTEAFNQAGPSQILEDRWFDEHLYDFEKKTTLLSIAPSKKSEYTAEILGEYLTKIFQSIDDNSNLEDHYPDYIVQDDIKRKAIFHLERVESLMDVIDDVAKLSELLKVGNKPWKILQKNNNPEVLSQVLGSKFSSKITALLLKRLEEISQSPREKLFLVMHKLGVYLNQKQNRNKETRQLVESLLEQAEKSECYHEWEAVFLQYRAKHHLSCNEFGSSQSLSERYFKDALEACERNNYGPLRGQVARDAFATLVANGKLIPNNHEKYYRNLLRYMEIEGVGISIENVAKDLQTYFWEDLYAPYIGVEKLQPKSWFVTL